MGLHAFFFLLYQSFVLFSFIFASLNPVLPFASGVCACIYCKASTGLGITKTPFFLSFTFVRPTGI